MNLTPWALHFSEMNLILQEPINVRPPNCKKFQRRSAPFTQRVRASTSSADHFPTVQPAPLPNDDGVTIMDSLERSIHRQNPYLLLGHTSDR